jgi:hypothetical protein
VDCTSAITSLELHPISGVTKAAFLRHSLCHTFFWRVLRVLDLFHLSTLTSFKELSLEFESHVYKTALPLVGTLSPLIAVNNLFLTESSAERIARTFRESVGGGMTKVLPTLQNISLKTLRPWEVIQDNIEHFVCCCTSAPWPYSYRLLGNVQRDIWDQIDDG